MHVKAVLLALAVSSTLVSAQSQQPPTFRSGVDLIEVDVTVLDDRGNPVPDLLAPEFAVTVDGEERRIVSVEFVRSMVLRSGRALRRRDRIPTTAPTKVSSAANWSCWWSIRATFDLVAAER